MKVNGTYKFFVDGQLVGQQDNLVTNMAKVVLLDFLSGRNESWAGSIAVGISEETALVTDTLLGFETGRANVSVREPRYDTGSIVCKATLPLNLITSIWEVGLFNSPAVTPEDQNDLVISQFSPNFDEISNVTSTTGRFGAESALFTLSGTSGNFVVDELGFRVDSLSSKDVFLFAYNATDISDVTINMIDEDDGERSYSFTPGVGFNVESFLPGDFSGAGSFDKTIVAIRIDVTGTSGGTLVPEGFRLHPRTLDFNDTLVSHAVQQTPVQKHAGEEMDIEFELTFGGLDA